MLCSHFGAAVAKIFKKRKEVSPYKVFGNPESLFSAQTSREKERLNYIYPSSNITCLIQFW